MKTKGISPSNFTLSVVIKLCCRCKRLDQAFKFTEQLNKEFRLKPNDHVYANLIQACVYCRAQGRALQVFEEMLQKGIRPLPRVYALLLRSAVSSNQPGLVKGLIELAVGARRDLPTGHVLESGLAESQIDAQTMSEILSRLTSGGHEDVADQIFCVVRKNSWCASRPEDGEAVLVEGLTFQRTAPAQPWDPGQTSFVLSSSASSRLAALRRHRHFDVYLGIDLITFEWVASFF
jgi:hypothetical protein